MRKIVMVLSSIIMIALTAFAAFASYSESNWFKLNDARTTYKETDKTSDDNININVMLARAKNWKRLVNKALIPEKEMLMIDGSTATIPITAEILRQFYQYSDDKVAESDYVGHSTTHDAYEDLIEKSKYYYGDNNNSVIVSLIFVTPPSHWEKVLAKKKNVKLDMKQIARDAFVFITHKSNPVKSLTIGQIQKIYAGKITNWKELGGEDLKIEAYQREENSGSQTAMEELVMKNKEMISPYNTKEYTMSGLINAVAEYENGKGSIGYTYNYYINNLYKNDNIKTLKVNGISPENKNVISEKYPLTTGYFAVIRKNEPKNSYARKLRDFLLTEKGQKLIEMAGYCRKK